MTGISTTQYTGYERAPVPPDGGWGWMIVFGSFIIHVVADGITYSFGLIFDEIVETFGGARGFAAWIPSILVGLTLGSGPLASAITNRYGCRTTTIIGSCTAAFGCILSCFATGVVYLMLSIGVIMGLGCGLMYCPAIVVVTMYFESKRAFATGIAVCGAGLGTFLFAPLTNFLIEEYTWRGTFLIYAGLLLNCACCGALFRPLKIVYTESIVTSREVAVNQCNDGVYGPLTIDTTAVEISAYAKTNILDIPALSAKTKSPSGASLSKKMNPLNLPPIVETDDDEDRAYAMNPHRKTSEHFLCELPLLEESQHLGFGPNVRMAITPTATPPQLDSPCLPMSRDLGNNLICSLLGTTSQQDGEVQAESTEAQPTHDCLKEKTDKLPRVSSGNRLSRFSSLLFLRNFSPSGIGARPVAQRTLSVMPHLTTSTASSAAPTTIAAHLVRRQRLKEQARAVEERRCKIVTEQATRFLRKDAFYSGSLQNIPQYRSNPDVYRTSVTSIPHSLASTNIIVPGGAGFPSRQISRRSRVSDDEVDEGGHTLDQLLDELAGQEKPSCGKRLRDLRRDIGEMTDVTLLTDKVYLLYVVSNFLTSIGFNIPLVFLPDRAAVYGFDRDQASWVLSSFGIANTIGRVLVGFVSDRTWAKRQLIYNISLTLCGLLTIFSYLFRDFTSLLIYAAGFGLTISSYVSLTSVILVDLLGLDRLTNAFGLLLLWQGVASLVGPPVAGWIYDSSRNYDHSFYFGGVCLTLSGLILFLLPLIRPRQLDTVGPKNLLSNNGAPFHAGDICKTESNGLGNVVYVTALKDSEPVCSDGESSVHLSILTPRSSPKSPQLS